MKESDQIFALLAAIVAVALVTTIVSRPNSVGVINATGGAFSGSLRAALGN